MAMDDSIASMGQMECGHLSIQQQLQNQASITIEKNRAILKSVLKAIIFCGKQNISLRGSCEAISPVSSSQFEINPGSFQHFFNFELSRETKYWRIIFLLDEKMHSIILLKFKMI